jgi:hypothetical protein
MAADALTQALKKRRQISITVIFQFGSNPGYLYGLSE